MKQPHIRMNIAMVLGVLVALGVASPSEAKDADFDSYWHDGKAELSGYRLTVSRYGQERTGRCVMIYVTEPFSSSKYVKLDAPSQNPKDAIDVLKLNLVRDFPTGIYDYNTMISTFVRTDDLAPVKISFTSAEWCGHVYEELLFDAKKIRGHYFSYFEGESGPVEIDRVQDGIAEDNLFILLRGLRGEFLRPGKKMSVPLLPSVFASRLSHESLDWTRATIERLEKTTTIEVPAGTFETIVYKIGTGSNRDGTFYIEKDYPHRIVRWQLPPDVRGELTGSERLQYWRLNRNGHESYLEKLGL
jgi:hypothetical protein